MTKYLNLKSLFLSIAILSGGLGFSSCSDDDDPVLTGTGIENAKWSDVNDASLKGETLIFEFEAAASWTASSDDDWCKVLTPQGGAGKSSLRMKVEPNDGKFGRSTTVKVQVSGYSEPCALTVRQGDGFVESGDNRYRDVNEWTYDLMSKNYLWNGNIPDLLLDYSIDYNQFLTSILSGVAENDDVNHDDGLWIDGQRVQFYSRIESNAPTSRTVGEASSDAGLMVTPTILGYGDDAPCGFAIMWVTPGSAAAEAGAQRGDFISRVNNIKVTETNYQQLGIQLLNGNVTVDLNSVEFNNGVPTVTNRVASVTIGSHEYVEPAIYKAAVVTASNGKKVGYLMYMNFHNDYDDELIRQFSMFKSENIDELVIDLRYNNGGHVLASTVLGTLVAGEAHKGQTYLRTTYNAMRTANGEEGIYRIGDAANPEIPSGYDKIAEALGSSLNLSQVYVIGTINTASASELLINGLRGLDIKVNLIGTTTQGKNCGMEGWQKRSGNYSFILYPITFYCENAKGFRDYADGFKPDLEIDDTAIYPGDFGTMDDIMSGYAITWASTGNKPNLSRAGSDFDGRAGITVLKPTDEMLVPLTRRHGGSLTLPKEM